MILAFISQKGGSGKTTLSVNLAALAATNGVPVAIVDLDPQARRRHGALRAEPMTFATKLVTRHCSPVRSNGCARQASP